MRKISVNIIRDIMLTNVEKLSSNQISPGI